MAPTKLACTFKATKVELGPVGTDGLMSATTTRVLTGDQLEGTSVSLYAMTMRADGNGSTYDGQQVFSGTILGRKGTVCFRTTGAGLGEDCKAEWVILPETATGELKGIRGSGSYAFRCACDADPMAIPVEAELRVEFE